MSQIEIYFTAPVPTPPTSVRSTETPASDHGTTIRVNVPSDTTARSEAGSSVKDTPRQIDKEPSQQQQVSDRDKKITAFPVISG